MSPPPTRAATCSAHLPSRSSQNGWVIVYDRGDAGDGVKPANLDPQLRRLVRDGAAVKSVVFTSKGWVIISDKGISGGGTKPDGMDAYINGLTAGGKAVKSVACT